MGKKLLEVSLLDKGGGYCWYDDNSINGRECCRNRRVVFGVGDKLKTRFLLLRWSVGYVGRGMDWRVCRGKFGSQSMFEVVLVHFLMDLGW